MAAGNIHTSSWNPPTKCRPHIDCNFFVWCLLNVIQQPGPMWHTRASCQWAFSHWLQIFPWRKQQAALQWLLHGCGCGMETCVQSPARLFSANCMLFSRAVILEGSKLLLVLCHTKPWSFPYDGNTDGSACLWYWGSKLERP